jgi:hypothetical protein
MPHLSSEALERLFTRDPDMTVCVHGLRTEIVPREAGPLAVARIVAHLVLEAPAEEDSAEVPEEFFLVLDIPMAPETVAMVNGHFDDTMDQMTEIALERLITEDGEP